MRKFYQTKCKDRLGHEIYEGDKLEIEGVVGRWYGNVDFEEGEFIIAYDDGDIDPLKDVANRSLIITRTYHG